MGTEIKHYFGTEKREKYVRSMHRKKWRQLRKKEEWDKVRKAREDKRGGNIQKQKQTEKKM